MQDLNDKATSSPLTATEWNEVPSELQNVIEALGLTLSSGDLNQLGKAIAGYVAGGLYYTDSGAADAYVLSTVGSKQSPTAYADGTVVIFRPTNNNTGAACTVNVASIGAASVKDSSGADPAANTLIAGNPAILVYDLANTWFELIPFAEFISRILDSNGNEVVDFAGVASAVNYWLITNSATGNAATMEVTGDDANVGGDLKTKGTGALTVNSKRDLEKGVIQFSEASSGAYQLVTNTTPVVDNTVPTATEGDEIITASITPIYTDSYIKISFDVSAEVASAGSTGIITVVDKTGATVLKVVASEAGATNNSECFCGHIYVSAPAGANTYSLRAGVYPSGNFHINGKAGSQVFGGTMQTQLTLEEVR